MRVDANDRLVVETADEKKKKKDSGGNGGEPPRRDPPRRRRRRDGGGGGAAIKVLFGFIGLVVLLVAGALIAPSFIDWNDYKDDIAAEIEQATGRRLAIDGDIALSLLPSPALAVENMRLANVEGAATPDMVSVKSLRVRVAAAPLLQGQIKVESIALVEPVIELERLPDGRANWVFGDGEPAPASTGGTSLPPLQLDSFTIEQGTLIYRAGGTTEIVENVDAEISAASLQGPFKANGTLTLRGTPLGIDLQTGRLGQGPQVPVSFDLSLLDSGARANFNGMAAIEGGAAADGKLELSGDSLAGVIAATAGGIRPAALDQPFAVRGNVALGPERLALDNLSVEVGEDRGTGSFTVAFSDPVAVDATVRLARLDLDKRLGNGGGEAAENDAADAAAAEFALPDNVKANVDVSIAALTYGGEQLRDVTLKAGLDKGALVIADASVTGPGDSRLRVSGRIAPRDGAPSFAGKVQASATNLRGVADWFEVPLDSVPSNRLRALQFAADVEATPARVQLTNVDMRLDAMSVTGGVSANLGARPGLGVALNIDRIDLDDYLGAAGAGDDQDEGGGLDAFDANLKLNVGTLTYNKTQVQGLSLEAQLRQGLITVNRIGVDNLAGARASFDGKVTGLPLDPAAKGAFSLEAKSLDGVARLAGIDLPVPADALGATVAKGQVDYAGGGATIDADVQTAGGRWKAKGTISDLAAAPRYDLDVDLSHPDLGRLARLAAVELPPAVAGLGQVGAKGKVKGDAGKATLDMVISAAGGAAQVTGMLAGFAATPTYDLAVDGSFPNAALPMRLAGIEPGQAVQQLGKFGLKGNFESAGKDIEIDTKLTIGGGGLSAKGVLREGGAYEGSLSANHPELRTLLAALVPGYEPPVQDLGTFGISLNTSASADRVRVQDLKGNVGPVAFSGALDLGLAGSRPRFVGKLTTGELPVHLFIGAATEQGGERWSREPIDLSVLDTFDAEVQLNPRAVIFDKYRVDEPNLQLVVENGILSIPDLSGTMFSGRFQMNARVSQSSPARINATLQVRGANLADALKTQGQERLTAGILDFDLDVSGAGVTQFDLVSNLNGGGRMAVTNGVIDGISVTEANRRLSSLKNDTSRLGLIQNTANLIGLVGGTLLGGQTKFSSLKGSYAIKNGVVSSNDISMIAEGGIGTGTLVVDLPRWTLDLDARFNFADLPDVPVGMRLRGPIEAPDSSFETAALQRHLIEQGGIGNLLQGVIPGLPGQQQQQPGQQPAPSGGSILPGLPQQLIPRALQPSQPQAVPSQLVPQPRQQAAPSPAPAPSPQQPGQPQRITPPAPSEQQAAPTLPTEQVAPAPGERQRRQGPGRRQRQDESGDGITTEELQPPAGQDAPAVTPAPTEQTAPPEEPRQGGFGSILDRITRPQDGQQQPAPSTAPQAPGAPGAPQGSTAPSTSQDLGTTAPGGGFNVQDILKGLQQRSN